MSLDGVPGGGADTPSVHGLFGDLEVWMMASPRYPDRESRTRKVGCECRALAGAGSCDTSTQGHTSLPVTRSAACMSHTKTRSPIIRFLRLCGKHRNRRRPINEGMP